MEERVKGKKSTSGDSGSIGEYKRKSEETQEKWRRKPAVIEGKNKTKQNRHLWCPLMRIK